MLELVDHVADFDEYQPAADLVRLAVHQAVICGK